MLVLGRELPAKRNRQWIDVLMDGKVVLSVCLVDVHGREVRLGFEAGDEFQIVRRELRERMETQAEGK